MEPAQVMFPPQNHAQTARGLGSQQKSLANLRGRGTHILGNGKRRWQDGDGWMADIGKMRVVEIQRVRNRAIGQGGGAGGHFCAAASDGCRRAATLVGDELADDLAQWLV